MKGSSQFGVTAFESEKLFGHSLAHSTRQITVAEYTVTTIVQSLRLLGYPQGLEIWNKPQPMALIQLY